MYSANFACDYYTSYCADKFISRKIRRTRRLFLKKTPSTDYACAGIRRLCRRLRHDGHADVKTTPHQLRLWVVVVYNAFYATHYVVNIKIDEQSYLFIG